MGFLTPDGEVRLIHPWVRSFDFALFLAFQAVQFFMAATGAPSSIRLQLLIAALAAGGLAFLSARRRRALGWRWAGLGPRQAAMAAIAAGISGPFALIFPPSDGVWRDGAMFPYFLGAVGIFAFWVMRELQIVRLWEAQFLADCGATPESLGLAPADAEPGWKKAVRSIFVGCFVLLAANCAAFMGFCHQAYSNASPQPTRTHPESFSHNYKTVYITIADKLLLDRLEAIMTAAIPSLAGAGLLLRYGLGVRLYQPETLAPPRRAGPGEGGSS